MDKKLIGVDLGGTTIKFAILTQDGEVQQKWSIKTDILDEGSHIVPDIIESINHHLDLYEMKPEQFIGIGMGTPGTVDVENGTVIGAYNLNWKTLQNVKEEVEKGNDIIEMQEPGETKIVSLDVLLGMNRDFLEKLFISVVDCLDDYELEDILTVLNISNTYKHIDMTIEGIDNFLTDTKISPDEFDERIRKMPDNLVIRLVERALKLDKQNQFDSYTKRKSLETRLNNPYLFKAV